MHRIELVDGAAPSFVARCRRPPQHEEEVERQVDELLRKGEVQEWTSPPGHKLALARTKDGRWHMFINFKLLQDHHEATVFDA